MSVLHLKTIKVALIASFLCALVASSTVLAKVSTRDLDSVRKMNVLGAKEQIVKDFVRERFDDLLVAKDSVEMSKASGELTSYCKNLVNNETSYKAYSDVYAGTIKGLYKDAFAKAASIEDKALRTQLQTQIAAVVAHASNSMLIEDLLSLLNNPTPEVRYWAVKGFALPDMQKFLTAEANKARADSINDAIKAIVGSEESPAIVAQAIFAANSNSPSGAALINLAVSKRIDMYINWTVSNELDDLAILNKLCDMLESSWVQDNTDTALAVNIAKQAVQLYTVGYQRYKMTQYKVQGSGTLNLVGQASEIELITMLGEAEVRFKALTGNKATFNFVTDMTKFKSLDNNFKKLFGANGLVDGEYERKLYKGSQTFKGEELFKDDRNDYLVLINKPTEQIITNAANLANYSDKIQVGDN